MNLGERLRKERDMRCMSREDMSGLTGVQANAQAGYEKGRRYPRADYLMRLCAAGWDVPYILTGLRTPVLVRQLLDSERQMFKAFRTLPDQDQRAFERLILSMAGRQPQVEGEPV